MSLRRALSALAQAAVTRTPDGTQHVVWLVDNADGTHNYEHTAISPSGAQGAVHRILGENWSALSTPVDLGVNADGSLRLAFRGTRIGDTSVFKVTDVDGAVAGAKVRAAGRRCTTTGSGKCRIRFPASSRPKKIRVKVTKASYYPAATVLRVRR